MNDWIQTTFGIAPTSLGQAAVDTLYMVGFSLLLGTLLLVI